MKSSSFPLQKPKIKAGTCRGRWLISTLAVRCKDIPVWGPTAFGLWRHRQLSHGGDRDPDSPWLSADFSSACHPTVALRSLDGYFSSQTKLFLTTHVLVTRSRHTNNHKYQFLSSTDFSSETSQRPKWAVRIQSFNNTSYNINIYIWIQDRSVKAKSSGRFNSRLAMNSVSSWDPQRNKWSHQTPF